MFHRVQFWVRFYLQDRGLPLQNYLPTPLIHKYIIARYNLFVILSDTNSSDVIFCWICLLVDCPLVGSPDLSLICHVQCVSILFKVTLSLRKILYTAKKEEAALLLLIAANSGIKSSHICFTWSCTIICPVMTVAVWFCSSWITQLRDVRLTEGCWLAQKAHAQNSSGI